MEFRLPHFQNLCRVALQLFILNLYFLFLAKVLPNLLFAFLVEKRLIPALFLAFDIPASKADNQEKSSFPWSFLNHLLEKHKGIFDISTIGQTKPTALWNEEV